MEAVAGLGLDLVQGEGVLLPVPVLDLGREAVAVPVLAKVPGKDRVKGKGKERAISLNSARPMKA